MPEGQVLEFSAVTKRFGAVTAVDGFTARVEPGLVTGFLGPNGAGKTTTLRVLLGLVRATAGTATIGGVPYAKLANPLQSVGAVLEASSFHPGRTAANHLKVYAQAAGLPASRVDEALGLVGLADVAGRKVGGYSLGMKQRLGLAYALLGDPGVLVLDEPANGLDPEGIKWMRGLLRDLARQGRTVLVSSHLLAEVQQTVDSLLIIATGRLVFQGALDELTNPDEFATVVDSPDRSALAGVLTAAGVEVEVLRSGLTVRGLDPASVGRLAADAGVPLSSLQRRGPALEEVFLDLVNGVRVHASAAGAGAGRCRRAGVGASPLRRPRKQSGGADEAADRGCPRRDRACRGRRRRRRCPRRRLRGRGSRQPRRDAEADGWRRMPTPRVRRRSRWPARASSTSSPWRTRPPTPLSRTTRWTGTPSKPPRTPPRPTTRRRRTPRRRLRTTSSDPGRSTSGRTPTKRRTASSRPSTPTRRPLRRPRIPPPPPRTPIPPPSPRHLRITPTNPPSAMRTPTHRPSTRSRGQRAGVGRAARERTADRGRHRRGHHGRGRHLYA